MYQCQNEPHGWPPGHFLHRPAALITTAGSRLGLTFCCCKQNKGQQTEGGGADLSSVVQTRPPPTYQRGQSHKHLSDVIKMCPSPLWYHTLTLFSSPKTCEGACPAATLFQPKLRRWNSWHLWSACPYPCEHQWEDLTQNETCLRIFKSQLTRLLDEISYEEDWLVHQRTKCQQTSVTKVMPFQPCWFIHICVYIRVADVFQLTSYWDSVCCSV